MKQLILSCVIDLPEPMFERASSIAAVQKPLDAFIDALTKAGLKPEMKWEETEFRPPPAKRGRKPRERLPTLDDVRGILAPEAA